MSAADRYALVELRDSRAYPAPWWRWLVVDTAADTIVAYCKHRHQAEADLERRLEEAHA